MDHESNGWLDIESMSRDDLLERVRLLQEEVVALKDAFRTQLEKNRKKLPKNKRICTECGTVVQLNYECKVCRNTLWGNLLKHDVVTLTDDVRERIDQEIVNAD